MAVTWNANYELTPLPQDSPTGIDDEVRALKDSISVRMSNEHETFETDNSSGAEGDDFVHKAGSAKVYYQAAAPTLRPDGVTALDAEDNGREWVDSDTNKKYVWVATEWIEITDLTEYGAKIDSDSSYFANEVLKYKVLRTTIVNGNTSVAIAHGISNAYTNSRVLDIRGAYDNPTYSFDTFVDGEDPIKGFFLDDTNIQVIRQSTTGSYAIQILVSYV